MKDPCAERYQESTEKLHGAGETLCTPAGTVMRSETIRQKIIGHRIAAAAGRFGHGRLFRPEDRDLALPNQPPRQVSRGVFVEPLIQQRGNLLPQIGGMAQARKLITLQGIARRREKEFPRRLGARSGQDGLLSDELSTGVNNHTITYTRITSNCEGTGLWKNVQKSEDFWRACSACAGDYEDPDLTAWVEIEPEGNEEDEHLDPEEQ